MSISVRCMAAPVLGVPPLRHYSVSERSVRFARLQAHRHWLSVACQKNGREVAFWAREVAWGRLGQ